MREQIETALSGLREGFQADGADLQVTDASDTHAVITLIGTDDTCWECIVDGPILTSVITQVVGASCPGIDVTVIDPRVEVNAN